LLKTNVFKCYWFKRGALPSSLHSGAHNPRYASGINIKFRCIFFVCVLCVYLRVPQRMCACVYGTRSRRVGGCWAESSYGVQRAQNWKVRIRLYIVPVTTTCRESHTHWLLVAVPFSGRFLWRISTVLYFNSNVRPSKSAKMVMQSQNRVYRHLTPKKASRQNLRKLPKG